MPSPMSPTSTSTSTHPSLPTLAPAPVQVIVRPPAMASQRQKINRACEPCRRRKAKCSGLAPCDFCQKRSFDCQFVSVRQKRGPRPKNHAPALAAPDTSAVSATSATPAASAPAPGASSESSSELLARQLSVEEAVKVKPVAVAVPAAATNETPPPARLPQPSLISRSPDGNDDQAEWHAALRRLMIDDDILDSGDPDASLRLRCHLVEIFFAHVNHQQTSMLDPDYFFCSLINNKCSPSLVNSICALSVPFSRHRALRSPSGTRLRQRFVSAARSQMAHAISQDQYLDRLQTLCVLVACEFAMAGGAQAWCDIASAHGLIQLATLGATPSPEEANVLKISRTHLLISERMHCLGVPGLRSSIHLDTIDDFFPDDPRRLACQLLDLLTHVQRFSSTSATHHDPAPWVPNSEFMSMINRLNGYMLREFDGLRFDSEILRSNLKKKDCAGPHIICLLAWHCCIILLNRVFLPIPQSTKVNTQGSTSTENLALNFPNAPKAFYAERIRTCEISAAVICNICRIVTNANRLFMPSFLGYCCFQSSVVMINQLRRANGENSELIDNLKVNFTILGAMGTFYKPAMAWSGTLFQLHRAEGGLDFGAGPLSDMFATYFSRFKDIKEPPYVGLEDLNEDALTEATVETPPAVKTPPIRQQEEQTVEIADNEEWMAQYESCLAEQLDSLEDEQHQNSTQAPVDAGGGFPLGIKISEKQLPLDKSPVSESSTPVVLESASHPGVVDVPRPHAQYHRQEDASSYPLDSEGMYVALLSDLAVPFQPGLEDANHSHGQITLSADGDLVGNAHGALPFDESDFIEYLRAGEQMFQPFEDVGFGFGAEEMNWELLVPDESSWKS